MIFTYLFILTSILSGVLLFFMIKFRKGMIKHRTESSSYKKYVEEIKHLVRGGNQLRTGFIDQPLKQGDGDSHRGITEVKETRRTLNGKSYIEVISASFPTTSDIDGRDPGTLKSLENLYGGWYDSKRIEWTEEINGREEILDILLKDIEEQEKTETK